MQAESAPEEPPQWWAPAVSVEQRDHYRALSKPLERACRTHLREQRDLRRRPNPPLPPPSSSHTSTHALRRPPARPAAVPSLALGQLSKLGGTEVAALLADLSPRMYGVNPFPRPSPRLPRMRG